MFENLKLNEVLFGVVIVLIFLLLVCPMLSKESFYPYPTISEQEVLLTNKLMSENKVKSKLAKINAIKPAALEDAEAKAECYVEEKKKERFEDSHIGDNRVLENYGANPLDVLTSEDLADTPFSSFAMEPFEQAKSYRIADKSNRSTRTGSIDRSGGGAGSTVMCQADYDDPAKRIKRGTIYRLHDIKSCPPRFKPYQPRNPGDEHFVKECYENEDVPNGNQYVERYVERYANEDVPNPEDYVERYTNEDVSDLEYVETEDLVDFIERATGYRKRGPNQAPSRGHRGLAANYAVKCKVTDLSKADPRGNKNLKYLQEAILQGTSVCSGGWSPAEHYVSSY